MKVAGWMRDTFPLPSTFLVSGPEKTGAMSTFIDENLVAVLAVMTAAIAATMAFAAYILIKLRRVRRRQEVVLGQGDPRDLVAHAVALQQRVDALAAQLTGVEEKAAFTNRRLDDCLTFRSVVRYDAYRDLSGMQSTSVALLDTRFSGIVISSIQGRDHARIYVKEIFHGESKEKLAPEEIQVLKEAMGLFVKKEALPIGGESDT